MAFPNNPTSPPVLELNSHAINTSCVGFWPLTHVQGTTATDISTGGNDGTLSGVAGWTSGSVGNAADIPTGTGNISIGTTSDFVFSDTGTMSVSFWAYFDSDNSRFAVLGTGITTAGDDWFVSREYLGGTGLNCLRFGMNYNNTPNATFARVTPDNSATAGTWNHWVIVASGGSSLTIYKDGVSQSLTTLSTEDNGLNGSATANTHELQLGSTGSTLYGTCDLQNVRIWDTALSASDVALLYSRPWVGTDYDELWPYTPPVPSSMSLSTDTAATSLNVGLEGWWACTDASGTTLVDISGNGRDATLNGTNSWETDLVGTVNRFDNDSSGGNRASTADHQIDLSNYTVALWVNHEEAGLAPGNKYGGGLSLTNGNSASLQSDVELYFNPISTSGIQWPQVVHNRSNGGTFDSWSRSEAAKTSENGVWRFYVLTYDGTNARFYKDAVLEGTSSSLAAPISTTGKHLNIDANADNSGITCSMQNIRLYSRALTADEITLLYERPWEGEATYGDALYNDPPPTLALGTTAEDVAINNSQEIWLPLTDGIGTTAVDISGNGNNGTLTGTSGNLPLWHVGKLGYSVAGDGTNARRVEISNTALSAVPAMSTSCWIFNDAVNNYEVYYGYGQLNYLFAFQRVATQDVLRFFTNGLTGNTDLRTPAGTLKTGVWQHVVGTYDGSTKRLYFDGVEVASASATGSITQPTSNTAILSASGSGYDVDGKVANLRVWSRALSAVEVQSLYETPWIGSNYGAVAAFYNYIYRSKRFRRL